jgi:hypothetical protein
VGSLFGKKQKQQQAYIAPPPPPPIPAAVTTVPTSAAVNAPTASVDAQAEAAAEVQRLKNQTGRKATVQNKAGALGLANTLFANKKNKLGGA